MTQRFVVQEHTTPDGVHWDLMLEQDDTLTTFRLEAEPAHCLTGAIRAVKIFDHPLRFLTYEGPVQKGTGKVRIVDSGRYQLLNQGDDRCTFKLNGVILQGEFTLTRIEDTVWQFKYQRSARDNRNNRCE